MYAANYAQLSSAGGAGTAAPAVKSVPIADILIYLVRMLDKIALMGCLVFSELPAHNKVPCFCCPLFWVILYFAL